MVGFLFHLTSRAENMDSCLSIKKSLASPYHCRQNTSLAGTHGVPRHSAVRHRHCGATTTSSMGSTKTNHQRNCEHIRADFPIKRNASCTPGPSHDWTRPAGAHLVAHGNSIVVRGARSPTSASLWTMAIRGSAVAPSHIHGL